MDQARIARVWFNTEKVFIMPTLGADAVRMSAKHPHYTTSLVADKVKLNRQATACLFRKLSEHALAERKLLNKGKNYMWNTTDYQKLEDVHRIGFISVGKAAKRGKLYLIENAYSLALMTEEHYLVLREISRAGKIELLDLATRMTRTVPYVLSCLQQLRKADMIETAFDAKASLHTITVVVKYPFGVFVMHECMFDIIRVLVVNPSMTSSQISDSTGLDRKQVGEVLTKLKENHLVKAFKTKAKPGTIGRPGYSYIAEQYLSKDRILRVGVKNKDSNTIRSDTHLIAFTDGQQALVTALTYKMLSVIKEVELCPVSLIAERLKNDFLSTYRYLSRFKELGLLKTEGSGRATKYLLPNDFNRVKDVRILTIGHN